MPVRHMAEPTLRVLIVDDEADIRESVEMIVESFAPDVEVPMARDGDLALELLEKLAAGGE
jgi:YesN/AraC family two-component response regulator